MSYKVFNNNSFKVGIRFEDKPNHEKRIFPNSFTTLTEDEILYTDAVSTLFKDGIIYVEDKEMLEKMGYVEKNPNTASDKEIEEIFKLSNKKMKEQLETLTSKHAIDKVINSAKNADLSQSKLKIIKEVFGVDIFEDLDGELI